MQKSTWTSTLLTAMLVAAPASAQEWPKAKPITFTVAFGAGSSTDIIARTVGQKVAESRRCTQLPRAALAAQRGLVHGDGALLRGAPQCRLICPVPAP